MSINRKFFFEEVKLRLFDGSMRPSQVSSLNGILDAWESRTAGSDDRWLAYMLGTTHHETGRTMQPVRETFASTDDRAIMILTKAWKAGKLPWVKKDYWSRDADGKSWLGRGFVQLTHKANYQKMAALTGEDLVGHPERAMDVGVATKVLIEGMIAGSFTGKKLGDYFSPTKEDWINARRIINHVERAELVASYARKYYAAISYTL